MTFECKMKSRGVELYHQVNANFLTARGIPGVIETTWNLYTSPTVTTPPFILHPGINAGYVRRNRPLLQQFQTERCNGDFAGPSCLMSHGYSFDATQIPSMQ